LKREIYTWTFFGKTKRKRPLERSICRWENNVKKNFKEMGWEGLDWIYLGQDMDNLWAFANAGANPLVV
jgi:hypothetical protein